MGYGNTNFFPECRFETFVSEVIREQMNLSSHYKNLIEQMNEWSHSLDRISRITLQTTAATSRSVSRTDFAALMKSSSYMSAAAIDFDSSDI